MTWCVLCGICILSTLHVAQVLTNPVILDSINFERASQAYVTCPPGYSQPDNANWTYCYKVYTDQKTRNDAASQCRADNGSLASVPNSSVNSYIYSLTKQARQALVFLGIECFDGDAKTCVNDDGSTFGYSNFRPSQPTPTHDCLGMSAMSPYSQQWGTCDCESEWAFVCEAAFGSGGGRFSSCPPNYDEYEGTCYRWIDISSAPTNVNALSKACQSIRGGNLATISNDGLNLFLQSKVIDYPYWLSNNWIAFGLKCPDIKFDGDQSSCQWDDGTQFGWNHFGQGFPLYGANGCCSTQSGNWSNCFPCDSKPFYSYFCQAPKQLA